jgi:hypothetical protein
MAIDSSLYYIPDEDKVHKGFNFSRAFTARSSGKNSTGLRQRASIRENGGRDLI